MPLGKPLADASSADGDVWSRKFEGGTEIFFAKSNTTGWVQFGAAAQRFIDQNPAR